MTESTLRYYEKKGLPAAD
ncbi:hypothetical protein R3Y73_05810 [Bacillus velezensis]|nr:MULTISPECIES: hypothetical protein [Bacillus]MCQ9195079.1 hypothetical protein [Bacillus velezensis]MCX2915965.1 hypothetical protein [Bacillus velezensis]MCY6274859.1 hypothetical protein [Bacillus sp. NEAU-16]MDA3607491.1 hypothetical protein [Bacillus sp. NEAU-242-2]WOQ26200.1 hypothetical protein R3Y73_05810 [Bacillus velezensis]